MQNLYQSKLRHWWHENMKTCAQRMAIVMSFHDPSGLWDPPAPAAEDCQQPGESRSAPENPWPKVISPPTRAAAHLPEQCEAVWRGVQAPGPLSVNWDNLEHHSSSRASLRVSGWPAQSCDSPPLLCQLPPSLPTAVPPQPPPPTYFSACKSPL